MTDTKVHLHEPLTETRMYLVEPTKPNPRSLPDLVLALETAVAALQAATVVLPSGSVLQYARTVGAAADIPITGAYADTGISAVLPAVLSAAANKVRIRVQFYFDYGYDQASHLYQFSLKRGSTDITPAQGAIACITEGYADGGISFQKDAVFVSFEWYDTPGAIGINTYHLIAQADGSRNGVIVGTVAPVVMTVEEIKA